MIQNFPEALQGAIQQNYLDREFKEGLEGNTVYRSIADPEIFPLNVGETKTSTRKGLKAPVTTPLAPNTNTNLDNGLTPAGWTMEQYTYGIDMYGDTIDLNMVTQLVGIEQQFLHNARTNGVQSAQSVDRLARKAILNDYMAGHSRVTATLGAPGTAVAVDDIRGFTQVPLNGKMVDIADATGKRLTVSFITAAGAVVAGTVIGAAADGPNTSSVAAIGGISGVLTFSANVAVASATANNAIISYYAPTILRPNGRSTTKKLTSSDLFSMSLALDSVTRLRKNAVPAVGGMYNCYLDDDSARQLFADPDFKQLFQGRDAAKEFQSARVIELLSLRFLPTTEAVQQALANEAGATVNVHRPFVCGAGTLVEGIFPGTGFTNVATNAILTVVNGIAMVTRPPLDRLAQIVAQSWYYIGGFVCPTDVTANVLIIPTASNALHKRGVMIEHA